MLHGKFNNRPEERMNVDSETLSNGIKLTQAKSPRKNNFTFRTLSKGGWVHPKPYVAALEYCKTSFPCQN
jgi:hypothetical protein